MQIDKNKAKSQKGKERSQFSMFWRSTSYFYPEIGAKDNLTSEDSIVFIFHGVESSLTTQCILCAQSACVALDMMFSWKSLQLEKSWEENNCSCSIKILPFPMGEGAGKKPLTKTLKLLKLEESWAKVNTTFKFHMFLLIN